MQARKLGDNVEIYMQSENVKEKWIEFSKFEMKWLMRYYKRLNRYGTSNLRISTNLFLKPHFTTNPWNHSDIRYITNFPLTLYGHEFSTGSTPLYDFPHAPCFRYNSSLIDAIITFISRPHKTTSNSRLDSYCHELPSG